MKEKIIRLGHGGGGRLTGELIRQLLVPAWSNPALEAMEDSARLDIGREQIAFTTDSYVVAPPFFPGGDIGKLAVCGTVNDLAVAGARPRFLSCGLILEEGFPIGHLEKIVASMKSSAEEAEVQIVTGDTKVVGRGKGDGVFINTAGVGRIVWPHLGAGAIRPGDRVLVNGFLGDHGLAVLKARGEFALEYEIETDCAPLGSLVEEILAAGGAGVRMLRDLTRGGLTAGVCEIAGGRQWGVKLKEESIPVRKEVKSLCEILGYDPLTVANEGKLVAVVSDEVAQTVVEKMKSHPLGNHSVVIGEVTESHPGRVVLETTVGGSRILDIPLGEDLPRIC
jgi:hydrogenase expression/formation protein HypE